MRAASRTPTLAEFKRFARDVAPAARAVLMARVFAEMERERVRAYIRPIFDKYGFTYGAEWGDSHAGEPIPDPEHLYLADDEVQVACYFEECDRAHRAHGFTGPHGHCPALVAENLQRVAEGHMIDFAAELFGVNFSGVYGEDRKRLLDLLIGAALQAEKDGTRCG